MAIQSKTANFFNWWYVTVGITTAFFLIGMLVNLIEYYHLQNATFPADLVSLASDKSLAKMKQMERYSFVINFLGIFQTFLAPLAIFGFNLIPRGWELMIKMMQVKRNLYTMILFYVIFHFAIAVGRCLVLSVMFGFLILPGFGLLWNLALYGAFMWVMIKLHGRFPKIFLMGILAIIPVYHAFDTIWNVIKLKYLLVPNVPRFVLDSGLDGMIRQLFSKVQYRYESFVPVDFGIENAGHAGILGMSVMLLFRGLVDKTTPGEVTAVIAHELGHWNHADSTLDLLFKAVVGICGWSLLFWLLKQPAVLTDQGFTQTEEKDTGDSSIDQNGLPIVPKVMLAAEIVGVVGFVVPILSNMLHWIMEFRADGHAHALGLAHEAISSFIKFSESNPKFSIGHWLYAIFYHDHPTLLMRIRRLQSLLRQ